MEQYNDPAEQLFNSANLEKYKMAGKITAQVLDKLVSMVKPYANIHEICQTGDNLIIELTSKVYQDSKYKGIAFPTCVSINNVSGFSSPLSTDTTVINDGDLVKVELGVHIEGFPALVAYTVVVNEGNLTIDDGRANVVKAVVDASKEIMTVMKPGKKNTDVVAILKKYADKYNVSSPTMTEEHRSTGVFSYQMSKYVIDDFTGDDCAYVHQFILAKDNPDYDFTMVECEFEEDDVYGIDVVYSTGSGKLKRMNDTTSIYKRHLEERYPLKMKASKITLGKFGNNPFPTNIGNMMDGRFKLGLKECRDHGLVEPYYPVGDTSGEFTARVKFTVIIRDKPILITGRSSQEQIAKLS